MQAYASKQILEDIYDLIKETALPDDQNDAYAIMSRKHAQEARRNLDRYLREKNIEWDGDNNTINIGKHITLKLIVK